MRWFESDRSISETGRDAHNDALGNMSASSESEGGGGHSVTVMTMPLPMKTTAKSGRLLGGRLLNVNLPSNVAHFNVRLR